MRWSSAKIHAAAAAAAGFHVWVQDHLFLNWLWISYFFNSFRPKQPEMLNNDVFADS